MKQEEETGLHRNIDVCQSMQEMWDLGLGCSEAWAHRFLPGVAWGCARLSLARSARASFHFWCFSTEQLDVKAAGEWESQQLWYGIGICSFCHVVLRRNYGGGLGVSLVVSQDRRLVVAPAPLWLLKVCSMILKCMARPNEKLGYKTTALLMDGAKFHNSVIHN